MFFLETRWLVSGATLAVLYWRGFDQPSVLFLFGAVLNAVLSKLLKRWLNAARPEGARLADPGMPSSHAQSLFFFAAYLGTALLEASDRTFRDVLGEGTADGAIRLARDVSCFAVWCAALGGSLTRVSSGLHTFAQVGVGGGIGAAAGLLWLRAGQPAVEWALGGTGEMAPAWAIGLLLTGALVVGSVERSLGASLKQRRD